MTPELFKLISPRINKRVLEVVHRHLSDEQIGLLLVKMINPYVVFSQQEEATLRGVDRKTLRGMKSRGELPELVSTPLVNFQDAPFFSKKAPKHPKAPHAPPRMQKAV